VLIVEENNKLYNERFSSLFRGILTSI